MKLISTYVWMVFLLSQSGLVTAQERDHSKMLQLMDQAEEAYYSDKYETSFANYSTLTKYNPHEGRFWYRMAYSAYRLGKYDEAIIGFSKDTEIGYGQRAPYHLAKCYALTGQTEEALRWFELAIKRNSEFIMDAPTNKDFGSISETTTYKSLLHLEEEYSNRDQGWRADLLFLKEKIEDLHYNYLRNDSKKHRISPKEWEEKVQRIYNEIPELEDHEVIVRMMQLTSEIGDGHSILGPALSKANKQYAFHRVPLMFGQFQDGLFVTSASKKYSHLVGCKVLSIGDIGEDELLDLVGQVFPHDSRAGLEWGAELVPSIAEIMHALNASDVKNRISYTLKFPDGSTQTVDLEADEELKGNMMEEWLYGFHRNKKWSHLNGQDDTQLALWQSKLATHYWFEYLPGENVMYFQYNQVKNDEKEPFDSFVQRLFEEIDRRPTKALVIDIRTNEGGNNDLVKPFLLETIKCDKINQIGKLWVITGNRTHSAAVNLVGQLNYFTNATLIGTPTSGSPNYVGETSRGVFMLPYSKLIGNVSTHLWQTGNNAMDTRSSYTPTIYIDQTSSEYKNNIDPVLDYILEVVRRSN